MSNIHRVISLALLLLISFSCSNQSKTASTTDSAQIIREAFSNGEIPKSWIREKAELDTLYILRTQVSENSDLEKINGIPVKYVEKNEEFTGLNKPWSSKYDKRWRYEITKLAIDRDSAVLSIYNYNTLTDFDLTLIKKNSSWRIIRSSVRME